MVMGKNNFRASGVVFFCLLFLLQAALIFADEPGAGLNTADNFGTINTIFEGAESRIAPGEFLPVSVKLVNFGSQKRVDVIIEYRILNSNDEEVYSESETVAVETTASFVKKIRLPYSIEPGVYTVVSSLKYPYQEDPAVSKFSILVEKKIAGFFKSDLIFYPAAVISAGVLLSMFFYLFLKQRQQHSIVFHDYSDKPKDQMIYYEILSDIISQMRLRIGDDALDMAKDIPDLEINDKNGKILNIKKEPAKIVALLVGRYEKFSGKEFSFGLRQRQFK